MATTTTADNTLYYGDNLDIMREHIATASVAVIKALRRRERGPLYG